MRWVSPIEDKLAKQQATTGKLRTNSSDVASVFSILELVLQVEHEGGVHATVRPQTGSDLEARLQVNCTRYFL